MMCPTFIYLILQVDLAKINYFSLSSIATATVIPTKGFLPVLYN